MNRTTLERIAMSAAGRKSPAAFRDHLSLSERSRQLSNDAASLGELFAWQVDERLYPDALQAMPFLLDRRSALWWGCLCVWQVVRPAPPQPIAAAIESAVRWIIEPTEAHRRAAQLAADRAGWSSAGCLAMAVFWSQGSMAPEGSPEVPVPPEVALQLVGRTVLLAAVENEPLAFALRHEQFLELGMEVYQGEHLWDARAAAVVEAAPHFGQGLAAAVGAAL
jgi:hypothetical protein